MGRVINPENNPLGLSMHEREICLDFLQGIRKSVLREYESGYSLDDFSRASRLNQRVFESAKRQLNGLQKTSAGTFTMELSQGATIDPVDLVYLAQSLGVNQGILR